MLPVPEHGTPPHTDAPKQAQDGTPPHAGGTSTQCDLLKPPPKKKHACMGPHWPQSCTYSHWFAGTHGPQQPGTTTLAVCPGGQLGGGAAHWTVVMSQLKPATHRRAWQSSVFK
jgi:hypothetical protein